MCYNRRGTPMDAKSVCCISVIISLPFALYGWYLIHYILFILAAVSKHDIIKPPTGKTRNMFHKTPTKSIEAIFVVSKWVARVVSLTELLCRISTSRSSYWSVWVVNLLSKLPINGDLRTTSSEDYNFIHKTHVSTQNYTSFAVCH